MFFTRQITVWYLKFLTYNNAGSSYRVDHSCAWYMWQLCRETQRTHQLLQWRNRGRKRYDEFGSHHRMDILQTGNYCPSLSSVVMTYARSCLHIKFSHSCRLIYFSVCSSWLLLLSVIDNCAFKKRQDKFIVRYNSTVNSFCKFCNN